MEINALSADDYSRYKNSSDMVNNATKKTSVETSNDEGNEMNNSQKTNTNYVAMNKDGDTLELSTKQKSPVADGKVLIEGSKESLDTSHFTDASLKKCSKAKLQQLLASGKISRIQYDKAMKKQANSSAI